MAQSSPRTWGTREEIEWLEKIGRTHEQTRRLPKATLLESYLVTAEARFNWGDMQAEVCKAAARRLLGQEIKIDKRSGMKRRTKAQKAAAAKYVGNKSTLQFHLHDFEKGDCNVEEIADANRIEFTTFEEAIGNEYQMCGHCAARADHGKRNPDDRGDDPGC